jgi:hypothetical protein
VWRTEPTRVENLGDDLWLGVKGQSNSVIAGSPRNAFRCSVVCFLPEVEQAMGPTGLLTLAKLRMPVSESAAVRLWGISSMVERETAQNTG